MYRCCAITSRYNPGAKYRFLDAKSDVQKWCYTGVTFFCNMLIINSQINKVLHREYMLFSIRCCYFACER